MGRHLHTIFHPSSFRAGASSRPSATFAPNMTKAPVSVPVARGKLTNVPTAPQQVTEDTAAAKQNPQHRYRKTF